MRFITNKTSSSIDADFTMIFVTILTKVLIVAILVTLLEDC